MASESAFFDRVRAHFLRRDLFPDKPLVSRKQTPYTEFVKCLHLFGAGILNKDELIQILRGLFLQGNTPKSGANASHAGNGAGNGAAMALLSELEKVLVGRGPFARQEQTKKFRGKYGSYPLRHYDLSDADDGGVGGRTPTPSYATYPSDFAFAKSSGETARDRSILNYECFCTARDGPPESVAAGDGGRHESPEDYDGIKVRRNAHEEVLARAEDEMHEVDMAIERNASAVRVLEPVAEEATRLREQEERDGQPIGRLRYKMRLRALNTIHIGAIARVYGERGEEVLQHLLRNPLVVVPILFKRLKEKNEEWRKVKKELNKEWKKTCSENITGSLDVKCFSYKREIEQSFTTERLLEECHKAKSFAKHPSKIPRHPATNMILPDWHLTNPDPALGLFQPHLSVLISKNMPHKHALDLLRAYFTRDAQSTVDKESLSTMWAGFIAPWFGLPLRWDESSGALRGKAPRLAPGQRVRTSVGDGEIVSVTDRKVSDSFRYLVKFSFGVGYVLSSGVTHLLPSSNTSSDMDVSSDSASQLMQDDIQVLFGTEKVYILMRLYILLVTILYQTKDIIDRKNVTVKPGGGANKSVYSGIMSSLQDLMQGKVEAKEFESECRKIVGNDMYNFVAIPSLVERCAEALVKVATEDHLEHLYHCSQLKLKDLNQLRNTSLDITDTAIYRLQIHESQVFFSYLPLTNPLHANPPELTESGDTLSSALSAAAKRPLETVAKRAANKEAAAASAQKRVKTHEERPKLENET